MCQTNKDILLLTLLQLKLQPHFLGQLNLIIRSQNRQTLQLFLLEHNNLILNNTQQNYTVRETFFILSILIVYLNQMVGIELLVILGVLGNLVLVGLWEWPFCGVGVVGVVVEDCWEGGGWVGGFEEYFDWVLLVAWEEVEVGPGEQIIELEVHPDSVLELYHRLSS